MKTKLIKQIIKDPIVNILVLMSLIFSSCSSVNINNNDCSEYNHQYNVIKGKRINQSKESWKCKNLKVSLVDSFYLKITWCNFTSNESIDPPVLWADTITTLSDWNSKFAQINNDTLMINYSETVAFDYNLTVQGADSKKIKCGNTAMIEKDSCITNIINISKLLSIGTKKINIVHFRDTWGDIYKKIE